MKTITVAAAIIMNDKNELLLVRKKNTRVFMQVGGKLEPNEAPEIAIQREILEEIGSTCDIKQYLGRYETATANEPDHQLISHLFVVELHQQPEIKYELAKLTETIVSSDLFHSHDFWYVKLKHILYAIF